MVTLKYLLYADDDDDDLKFFSEAIAEFPEYSILTFTSGIALLAFVDSAEYRSDIHLIVSDINMPAMNGLQLVRHLKSRVYSRDIPVCLYSTSVNPMDQSVAAAMDTRIYLKASRYRDLKKTIAMMLTDCCEPVRLSSKTS